MTRPGYISWSQASTYNDCAQKYKLRYIDKVPQVPGGALIAGSAVHSAIEHSEANDLWQEEDSFEQLESFFLEELDRRIVDETDPGGLRDPMAKDEWIARVLDADGDEDEALVRLGAEQVHWGGKKSKEFPGGENRDWWRARGPEMLRRYTVIRRRDLERGNVVLPGDTERYVSVMVDSGLLGDNGKPWEVLVKGYIDQVLLANADGEQVIRDWKTGYHRIGQEIQLACYAWMLSKVKDVPMPTTGEIVSLKGQNINEAVKTFDLEPLVPLLEPKFQSFLQRLDIDTIFDPSPGYCGSCGVKAFCSYGKTLPDEE